MTTVGDLVAVLDVWFPPSLAEDWDAVGLLTGRRADVASKVAFAVEVTDETLEWAIAEGAQLLFVHHPLYLRGTTNVDGDSAKGALIHRAITSGLALFVAHTNADIARPGVSDALATAFGLDATSPIRPLPLNAALGVGRTGLLDAPVTLAEFVQRVVAALPLGDGVVRWAGDPQRRIESVALCGGAGDDLLSEVRADVYVTSDLRHHVALDYLATNQAALIDIPHAVAESLWLAPLATRVAATFADIACTVYEGSTDPWSGAVL